MEHEFIISRLCQSGFDAYLTGGAVRDLFMDRRPYDFDIVTNAHPNEINIIFLDQNIKNVGKSFAVCLVNGIEVASYRKDRYFGLSDKNCKIELANSIKEDLERRDLTINSMALCPYTGDVIDPFNGLEDIKNKIIRLTGDPNKRIHEDPNRIIRACRFLSNIDGCFDLNTFFALRNNSDLIKNVSPERIRLEILKALKNVNVSLFFSALESIGVLKYIFPELKRCVFHNGGKYHIENVFEHCMLVGDNISSRFPLLKLAGYLHDIGKPYQYDSESETFYKHDKKGEELSYFRLKQLKFSNYESEYISKLVGLHMQEIKDLNDKSIRKLLRKLKDSDIDVNDLIRLKIADRKGSIKKDPYSLDFIKNLKRRIENALNLKTNAFSIKDLKITGFDVMNELNLNPGPEVGNVLRYLFKKVIENPELNNYETLLKIIKEEFPKC